MRHASRAQTLLVTGSSGLIGSEVVDYFSDLGWRVYGVDNNMRADFFGPGGDTRWNQRRLQETHSNSATTNSMSATATAVGLLQDLRPADRAYRRPAEPRPGRVPAVRRFRRQRRRHAELAGGRSASAPAAVFVHLSTNKVYGDPPNELPLRAAKRWDYAIEQYRGRYRRRSRSTRASTRCSVLPRWPRM